MDQPQPGRITELLNQVRLGDRRNEEELVAGIYGQLRKLARQQMRYERAGHTLQATAVVHEAYLRLFGKKPENPASPEWANRQHFLAIAAREIRRVLIEHARSVRAEKRGGNVPRVSLDELVAAQPGVNPTGVDVLDLTDRLGEFEQIEPEAARIVELKFFGGLTDEEVAAELGISFAKVRRDWAFARAWLLRKLESGRKIS